MNKVKKLQVAYNNIPVGMLALSPNNLLVFEYDKEWLVSGFSISPYSLPLAKKVYIPKPDPFNGGFGVFNDSLPDGWGKFLVDRMLAKKQMNPFTLSMLDRLAIVGSAGMGALTYHPNIAITTQNRQMDFDDIATACTNLLKTEFSSDLDSIYQLGGSSGGARPKILTSIDQEDWIIKFPSSFDKKNIGEQEYRYSLCAKDCHVTMEETRLFPSKICSGFFGTKRFDRVVTKKGDKKKIHMVSASGLLETTHRIPNLDYNHLMKLTLSLTKDFSEVERLYRQMCFNVFSNNRDDHSKNFSYIYNDMDQKWELSKAYDLTYSFSIGGEHATSINGNGKNPNLEDLLAVAKNIGLEKRKATIIAKDIKVIVHDAQLTKG